jgi:hypothetical protein
VIVTVLKYSSHSEEIMPTVSESLAKLSASMTELSQRAKEAEDHIAAARHEAHEQLEARAAEARATAQRRREEMKARGAKVKDDLASAWASLRAQVQEQFEKMRAKLEEKRDDLDAKAAERRAERAEAHAGPCGELRPICRRRSRGGGPRGCRRSEDRRCPAPGRAIVEGRGVTSLATASSSGGGAWGCRGVRAGTRGRGRLAGHGGAAPGEP